MSEIELLLRDSIGEIPEVDVSRDLAERVARRRRGRRGARVALGACLLAVVAAGVVVTEDRRDQRSLRVVGGGVSGGATSTAPQTEQGATTAGNSFKTPIAIAPAGASGAVLVVAAGEHRVWRLEPDGRSRVLAGTGRRGFSGDGGPAVAAELAAPYAAVLLPTEELVVADAGNARLRLIAPDGTISSLGYGSFGVPQSLAVTPRGSVLVASTSSDTITEVTRDGGARPFATSVDVGVVSALAVGKDGTVYVGGGTPRNGQFLGRVRRISPDGDARDVVVGGDDGSLRSVSSLWVDGDNLYVVDNVAVVVLRVHLPSGEVTAVDLSRANERVRSPMGVVVDGRGHLLLSDIAAGIVHDLGPA